MIEVKLYKFQKKDNSTAQPVDLVNVPLVTQCTLKDDCSVVNPVLQFNPAGVSELSLIWEYNYIKISMFGRYYYVDDWQYIGGLWECYCHVDVLASFKQDIRGTFAYVTRSTRDANGAIIYNPDIIDTSYPATGKQASYYNTSITNPFAGAEGVYVCGIINNDTVNGSVTYYAFNQIGFNYFTRALFNYSTGWLDIDVSEISENLQKALINPFQYIVSCNYFPLNVSDFSSLPSSSATSTIKFGWWSINLPVSARIFSVKSYVNKTFSLTIPRHPNTGSRGWYLNLAPWAIYTLRAYPFGTIDIDSEAIARWNTVDLHISIDCATGSAILNVCVNGLNNPIRTIEAQFAVAIPTASLQVDYKSLVSGGKGGALAAGASLAGKLTEGQGKWYNNVVDNAKNFVSSIKSEGINAVKEVAADIATAAVAATTTVEITGQQSCASGFLTQPYTLSGRFLPIAPEDFEHRGRPLMEYRQLLTLSGFILCRTADIKINCTDRERDSINAFLTSGFYME